ncbi:MAG: LLM class flavin-dependent oxidoreductase [Actinobacteria bacterium]|nr:MAG: LLM class flavin-dependent oxidoreductase [Actinomycetota bacterium]
MRFGLFVPAFAELADPRRVADLAHTAEESGWEGFYLWDHVLRPGGMGVADPWVTLAAVATATERVRIGTLVTPLARRRPWVLARQVSTLDHLSGGRVVVGIGLGHDGWREFSAFGEVADARGRGRLLDESLDVLRGLLGGGPVKHRGDQLAVDTPPFVPRPVQDPLPIWAACQWPNRRPLVRAARLQGCFPIFPTPVPPPPPTATEVAEVRRELDRLGARPDLDLVVRCSMSLEEPSALRRRVSELGEAGVTWMLEGFAPGEPPPAVVEQVVRRGPPQ